MTTSLRLVNRTKLLERLNLITTFVVALLFLVFLSWSAICYGFHEGFVEAFSSTGASTVLERLDSIQDEQTYAGLSRDYRYLCALFMFSASLGTVWQFAHKQARELAALLTLGNLSCLILAFMRLKWLIGFKNPNLNESLASSFNDLVRSSVPFDYGALFASIVLILFNIWIVWSLFFIRASR